MSDFEKAVVFLVLSNVMLAVGERWPDLMLAITCLMVAAFRLFRSVFPAKADR